jgi:hypothetical protein
MNPLFFIIKAFLCHNNAYQKYCSVLNLNFIRDGYKDLYKILKVLFLFKEKYPLSKDVGELSLFFFAQYPGMKADDSAVFIYLFERLAQIEIKEDQVYEYLESYRQKELSTKIAIEALASAEGRSTPEKVIERLTLETRSTQQNARESS